MLQRLFGDNPLVAFFRDAKPHRKFMVSGLMHDEGEIRGALEKFKVENWGYVLDDDAVYLFCVLEAHVQRAIRALKLAGIEFTHS